MTRITCPKCGEQIVLEEVKLVETCPACGGKFRVVAPRDSRKTTEKEAGPPARDSITTKRRSRPSDEEAPDERRERRRRRAEEDNPDPMPRSRRRPLDDDDFEDRPRRKRLRARRSSGFALSGFVITLLVLGTVWVGGTLLELVIGPVGLVVAIVGMGAMVTSSLWFMRVVLEEDGCGHLLACWFIPFYGLFYIVTHLDQTGRPLLLNLVGLGMILTGVAFQGGGSWNDSHPDVVWEPPVSQPPPAFQPVPVPPAVPPSVIQPVPPPVEARESQITYKVVGARRPTEQRPQIQQALADVPGLVPGSVEVTADSVSFRLDKDHRLLTPAFDALTRMGYQITSTTAGPVP